MSLDRRRPRWARTTAVMVAVATVAIGAHSAVGAETDPVSGAGAGPAMARPERGPHDLTLITGDRITVRVVPGGYAVQSRPEAGRRTTLRQQRAGGRHYVIPAEAAGLVAAGKLDRQLFDLETLIRSGVDDKNRPGLPLLVQYDGAAAARAKRSELTATGARVVRELPTVRSVAIEQPKTSLRRFWQELAPGVRRSAGSGVRRVWLDAGVRPLLDQSTRQIGAPQAWAAGLTGKGVRVAVLDTGIDDTHPDLAGSVIAARDFVGPESSAGVSDEVGHGTHVASIAAGSGEASGGRFRGVAPDAELLVGKVCGDFGCPPSSIIAGMQWAVAQGARVVNLSLGGGPSDGTDPVSEAVNEITAASGTLFVVAAGNYGALGESTVSSPGAADAALTVGSVTKSDLLSVFSSRGPRFGDGAVKPDLTAPGGRIAAARATGTLDGVAVAERYAELSGTSMAAPHVAGAAALLAQLHPDWKADRLKATLMGSASPNAKLDVYQQGSGRVDLTRAIRQQVVSEPASLSFGIARWPHHDDQPVRRTVSYVNSGDQPLTLTLQAQVEDASGRPSAASLLRLDQRRLVVPARGVAQVGVTMDTSQDGPDGRYGGWLVAASGDGSTVVRTPVGFDKEVRSYDQSVTVLGRDGKPVGTDPEGFPLGNAALVSVQSGRYFAVPLDNGSGKVRVPAGTYVVDGWAGTIDQQGRSDTMMVQPSRVLDSAQTLVLDARDGRRVTIGRPRPDAHNVGITFSYARALRTGGSYLTTVLNDGSPGLPQTLLYATPTEPLPAREFTAVAAVIWAKLGPRPDGSWYHDSPFVYNQVVPFPGRVPADLTVVTDPADFAVLRAGYASDKEGRLGVMWRYPSIAWPDARTRTLVPFVHPFLGMSLPFQRTEYYSKIAGPWLADFERYADGEEIEFESISSGPGKRYQGGSGAEVWNRAVFGPGLPGGAVGFDGWAGAGPTAWAARDGDTVTWQVPLFSEGSAGRAGASLVDKQTTELYRDGELLRRTDTPYRQLFRVPAEAGRYRLETTAVRPADRFGFSTTVRATWSFRSAHTPDGVGSPLPLLAVRFSPKLDLRNRAPGAATYRIPVTVQRQHGSARATVRSLEVEASSDDGKTWHSAVVRRGSGGWTATVKHGAGGHVSLRAKAIDSAGNSVEQTIVRAYALAPPG